MNGRRVLVPVTDDMPLDAEGMKALAGEETIVQENIGKGLTPEGKAKRPSSRGVESLPDPEGKTLVFP